MTVILNTLFGAQFFQREASFTEARRIIGWWESRRVCFNLVIGIVGTVTIATGTLAMSVINAYLETPIQRPDPPLFFFAFLYALVVNFFYTGGWLAELVLRRLWNSPQDDLAVLSLRLGLVFTVLVTLLPAFTAVAYALHAMLTRRPMLTI